MGIGIGPWLAFGTIVIAMLAIDLGVNARRERGSEPTVRQSALWTAAWVGAGVAFSLVVLAFRGADDALTYLAAYLLEKSLSVDNIFVFVLVFSQLEIPIEHQRRVLYWGIIGALGMRALLIGAGVYLLQHFEWVIYPFAALIIFAAVRIIWGRERERTLVTKACAVCGSWVARLIPITPVLHGGRFWIRQGGHLVATPLLIALIVIETTDVVFALDSIPAVLSITKDLFLVYTSNVFALLGLRSLYFLLAGVVERFRFVRYGLAAILLFVGAKMLLTDFVTIPTSISLGVISVALGAAVIASLVSDQRTRGG
jgi:TerC family integral membrane protein